MFILGAMVGELSKGALAQDNQETKQFFQSAIKKCEGLGQRISAGEDIDINLVGIEGGDYLDLEVQCLGGAIAYGCVLQFGKDEEEKEKKQENQENQENQ